MGLKQGIWASPVDYLVQRRPEDPVLFCAPELLHQTAHRFLQGFPGLVTYAVKANPDAAVLSNLNAAGVTAFDVASPEEISMVRAVTPNAVMHYNNPVRSLAEIEMAARMGVRSYSVDSISELEKLVCRVPAGSEISVRFKLPVTGAAYDFGSKFGANPDQAARLLSRVVAAGFSPALTFHPGTQCTNATAWEAYVHEAARIAADAGTRLSRLNVGGGFPAHREHDHAPDLEQIFATIDRATDMAFGTQRPDLICEPGRAMVAESMCLAVQIKAIRDGEHVFLNDGIYGCLAELPLLGMPGRLRVVSPDGTLRSATPEPCTVFGPTCDSLDHLPGQPRLPADISEGDYILIYSFGAYSAATATRFNGYGAVQRQMVITIN